jgi:hypothetical protein
MSFRPRCFQLRPKRCKGVEARRGTDIRSDPSAKGLEKSPKLRR